MEPNIVIGIDTGGTYTDAVAFDAAARCVLAKAKSRTTKEDLSIGIAGALDALPADCVRAARRVALSTTLATNACVEGKGCRAKLVLMGTTQEILVRVDAERTYGLRLPDVLALDTRGSFDGSVVDEPDWTRVIEENRAWLSDADAIAVCEANAARNGAVCERGAREALERAFGIPVIMASDLAEDLNMMERGATALLDARLLPVIAEFVSAVRSVLAARGVEAEIGIVRSDGSRMGTSAASDCPVETIVSGPAASVLGARELASCETCLVVDMGGTTTDVSIVEDGAAVMSDRTRIGSWRTQVKGVHVETFGLGGDTEFVVRDGALALATRRVEPLCAAVARWPQLKDALREVADGFGTSSHPLYEALYLVREPKAARAYTAAEQRLIDVLREGPALIGDASRIDRYTLESERLEAEGVVMRCGFTPTDAMHLLGDFDRYDTEASELAARCLIHALPDFEDTPEGVRAFARAAYRLVEKTLFERIVDIMLRHRYPEAFKAEGSEVLDRIVAAEWERAAVDGQGGLVDVAFRTQAALVGVGAPTHVFLPAVAAALGTRCVISRDSDVANAVGAATSSVGARAVVRVVPQYGTFGIVGYVAHTRAGRVSAKEKDEALAIAEADARDAACCLAQERGAAGDLSFEVVVKDSASRARDGVMLDMGTEVAVTALAVGYDEITHVNESGATAVSC